MSDYPKPGPELDALVAERVMGWHKVKNPGVALGSYWHDEEGRTQTEGLASEWSPSTRIEHAWEVVEKVGNFCIRKHTEGYSVSIKMHTEHSFQVEYAICIAALEAVRGEVPHE